MGKWFDVTKDAGFNAHTFTKGLFEGADVQPEIREKIISVLLTPLYNTLPGSRLKSLNIIFNGPDKPLKRSVAKHLASRLNMNFIFADCAEFAKRERASGNVQRRPAIYAGRGVPTMTPRVAEEDVILKASMGMSGWFAGPPVGVKLQDVEESLAEQLQRDPNTLVYLESLENAGPALYWWLDHAFDEGYIHPTLVNPTGVPISGTIFVLGTDLRTGGMFGDIRDEWKSNFDPSSEFIYETSTVDFL